MSKSIASLVLDHYHGVPTEPLPRKQRAEKIVAPQLSDEDRQTKKDITDCLRVGKWFVEFTKVDGTPTTMECTLDQNMIPEKDRISSAAQKRELAEHLIHVYALDRKGWRSFVFLNVTKMYRSFEGL